MNDDRHADELVSAYLAGELDAAETAAFERRLRDDARLRARIDALADALVALRGHDLVEEPPGYRQRLEQRLAAETGSAPVTPLDERRAQRSRSGGWWSGVAAAAAVVALGAVFAAGALRDLGGRDVATTMADDASGGAAVEAQDEAAAGAPPLPVIVDEQVAIADEDALRARFADLPEAAQTLGTPVEQAEALADEYAATVEAFTGDALLFSRGSAVSAGGEESAPGDELAPAQESATESPASPDCLDVISQDAPAPVVPVRVETLRYAGRAAVAYVVVTTGRDAQRLSRTEVWVVEPHDCSTITFLQL